MIIYVIFLFVNELNEDDADGAGLRITTNSLLRRQDNFTPINLEVEAKNIRVAACCFCSPGTLSQIWTVLYAYVHLFLWSQEHTVFMLYCMFSQQVVALSLVWLVLWIVRVCTVCIFSTSSVFIDRRNPPLTKVTLSNVLHMLWLCNATTNPVTLVLKLSTATKI